MKKRPMHVEQKVGKLMIIFSASLGVHFTGLYRLPRKHSHLHRQPFILIVESSMLPKVELTIVVVFPELMTPLLDTLDILELVTEAGWQKGVCGSSGELTMHMFGSQGWSSWKSITEPSSICPCLGSAHLSLS